MFWLYESDDFIKWKHTVFVFLCLSFLTQHPISEVHPCCEACVRTSVLFVAEQYSISYFPIARWLDYPRHSACSRLLVTVNDAAMSTGIQAPVQVPAFLLSWVSTIPTSGTAGLYGDSMFNFLKSHQLYLFTFSPAIPKFSISPHPHKHLLFCFVIATPNGWQRPRCWERLKAGGEGDDRGQDGWMASPTQRTWVWASSGRWWRTGKPGMLQSMGLQRIGYD